MHVLNLFIVLRSPAVPKAMAGNGCIQRLGPESETWGTGLLQDLLRASVLAQAVLKKILEALFQDRVTS